MYINCLHGALPFYWVSLYNHMICKCAGVTGYEHEEFIVKLPGIIPHKQILTWSIVFFNNCRTK